MVFWLFSADPTLIFICFHENMKHHTQIKIIYEIAEFLTTSLTPQSAYKNKKVQDLFEFL